MGLRKNKSDYQSSWFVFCCTQNTYFGWEVLMHPPYSPDLAPSDFHLFPSLQNSLGSVKLTSREDCQNYLSQFFDQKPQKFYSNGITSIPTRWQKVIQQNGTYIL
ncbi:hypothetical protein K1T71_000626 [Dendrolimus kikuchii]|uniref:Uncharacterized protein n=1 Tax=Dendrolimus kikuchii TaxID=765133 RepID=A0ACC1DJR5_9NEOP|nr:hypothetical protein K1T71_000626 [Dendrolimus kikuchii]